MFVWPRRWVRRTGTGLGRVGASGGGRVVPASGDDCHTPAPGPRDPSTNHVAPCPARTRRTGYPRRPGRSGSDCCDPPYHRRSLPETADRQRWPARLRPALAAMAVSMIVVVSPTSAPCSVTATIAPVSMSTACSALCARCVRPSFIFVTFASGSWGCVQSVFEVFFFRFRSSRARPSRVGVSTPEAVARPARNAW